MFIRLRAFWPKGYQRGSLETGNNAKKLFSFSIRLCRAADFFYYIAVFLVSIFE